MSLSDWGLRATITMWMKAVRQLKSSAATSKPAFCISSARLLPGTQP